MWEMADDIQPPQDHDIPPTGRLHRRWRRDRRRRAAPAAPESQRTPWPAISWWQPLPTCAPAYATSTPTSSRYALRQRLIVHIIDAHDHLPARSST